MRKPSVLALQKYLANVKPKRGVIDLDKKEFDQLRRRVMGMLAKLPEYMFISKPYLDVKSVDDITKDNDPVFEKVVGVSNEDFATMCGPFIREDRLNRCIVSFNQLFDI